MRGRLHLLAYDLIRLQEVPADQGTPEEQKCLIDVSAFFVSYAQAPKLIQPSEGPFYHPPPSSQTAAVFRIADGQQRQDATGTKPAPKLIRVIGAVTQQAVWMTPRSSQLSTAARDQSI
jgi:hypothetical protein